MGTCTEHDFRSVHLLQLNNRMCVRKYLFIRKVQPLHSRFVFLCFSRVKNLCPTRGLYTLPSQRKNGSYKTAFFLRRYSAGQPDAHSQNQI